MKYNMKNWLSEVMTAKEKKAFPVLSFPCVSLLGITVKELISNSNLQAKGMKLVADNTDSQASVSFMDLSVEAECFGATISVSDGEVPTVRGRIINSPEDAEALEVVKRAFPERDIVPFDAKEASLGGGGLHCLTKHIH